MADIVKWRVGLITVATALLLSGCLRHSHEVAKTGSIKDEGPATVGKSSDAHPAKSAKTPARRPIAAPAPSRDAGQAATKTAAADRTNESPERQPEKLAADLSGLALSAAKPPLHQKRQPGGAAHSGQGPGQALAPIESNGVPHVARAAGTPAADAVNAEPVSAVPRAASPETHAGTGAGATPIDTVQPSSRPPFSLHGQPSAGVPNRAAKAAGEDRLETARLIAEGKKLFQEGKVIEARRRFVAALHALSPEATVELARTFDTFYLSKLATSDGAPDMQRALRLYQTAMERGARDADFDMGRVKAALEGQAVPAISPAPASPNPPGPPVSLLPAPTPSPTAPAPNR